MARALRELGCPGFRSGHPPRTPAGALTRKDRMNAHFYRSPRLIAVAVILALCALNSGATEKTGTFVLTLSLPNPTMRMGDDLLVDVITSNPTDHVVYAGEGPHVGLAVELLNGHGEDIGLHAMGGDKTNGQGYNAVFMSFRRALKPGIKFKQEYRFKPEQGYLVPGTYKARVYQRDLNSNADVYSNQVVLTVTP